MMERSDKMNLLLQQLRRIRSSIRKRRSSIWDKKRYNEYMSLPEECGTNNSGIVIVLHEARLGGAPLLGLNMAKEYRAMGYSVDVISLRYGEMIQGLAEICPVQVCLYKRDLIKTIKELRRKNYKTVLCNSAATGWALPYFNNGGFRSISLVHELPGVIHYLGIENDIKMLCNDSDKIVFPSSYVLQKVEEEFGTIHSYAEIYHQGLFARPSFTITKDAARKELESVFGIDTGKKLFINVATINKRKGFDLFVEMADLDQDSIYLWVGDGADSKFGSGVLSRKSSERGNLILPGYISDKRKMTVIYSAATALLLTSREEPFGSVVLEAFANKTPVVAFDRCGGYIDVVRPGETGDLVEPYDIHEMIQKARKLSENDVDYKKIVENCYNVAQEASFDNYCKRLIEG